MKKQPYYLVCLLLTVCFSKWGFAQNPVVSINTVNNTCYGSCDGQAHAVATGGSAPYTFSWTTGQTSASISGLCPGTYTVKVTDMLGHTGLASGNVSEPPALTVTPSQTNVSCNGAGNGTASVTVSGGTPGYTYTWSPGPGSNTSSYSPLPAGSYSCTILDSHGCTYNQVITITQPAPLVLTPYATPTACNGSTGTGIVSANGGTPGYTYSWNPAPGGGQGTPQATGLGVGSYTVAVTDGAGCTGSTSIQITTTNPPTVTPTSVNPVSCNGGATGSASISASGGTSPYTYTWSPPPGFGQGTPNAGGLSAGTYTATVTDGNGCINTNTINITQPGPLSIVTTTSTSESCGTCCDATASVIPSGGTPPYAYSWNTSPVQTTYQANSLCQGTYTVCVTDKNGCPHLCNSVSVSYTMGISSEKDENSWTVYPNPVSGTLSVALNFPAAETIRLDILNILGELVYSETLPAHALLTKTIDMHNLNAGLYLLSIHSGNQTYTRKVLKQ